MRADAFRTRPADLAPRLSAGFSHLTSAVRALCTDRRAQTEILGVVLLIGIVAIATTSLALYGNAAATANEDRIAVERAETGLTQLDTRASRVAFEESDVQRMQLGVTGTSGSLDTRPTDGWIRVEIVYANNGTVEREVVDQTMGAVVYTLDDATVAYQGGGVWRGDGDGSAMVSRPEFHFEDGTLTLPIVVAGGDGAVYDEVAIRPDGPVVQKFPDYPANLTNKVVDLQVRVTVQSDYYEAWGRYLEAETGYDVDYNNVTKTATVTFDGLNTGFGRHGGIIATAGDGEIRLGGRGVYIDSYDSTRGNYSETQGSNGILAAVNDVTTEGNSTVDGDVAAGRDVDMGGESLVNGGAYWGNSFTPRGSAEVSRSKQISGVESIPPIDGYVQSVVTSARTTNDNDETRGLIRNDRLTGSGRLTAGTYYLDELTVGADETLTIDTTEGDVVIAVEDSVTIEGGGNEDRPATVRVVGPGTVEVVVLGGSGDELTVGKNAYVDVPGERATQFRIYGTSEFEGEVSSNRGRPLRFEGVIYAPAGLDGDGSVTIKQAEVYGTVVSGRLTISQYAEIHYDESLSDDWFPGRPFTSNLEYLHVSVHPIEVTNK